MGCTNGRLALVGSLAAFAVLGGCESLMPPVGSVRVSSDANARGQHFLHANSNRRLVYVTERTEGNSVRRVVVAEPPPDTALESTGKLIAKATASEGASGELSAEVTQKIIELTKRTQAIIILRDSLFRLELAYANGAIDGGHWREGFESVLDTARVIALADLLGEVNASPNEATKANASQGFASLSRAWQLEGETRAMHARTKAMALELLKVNPEIVERYNLIPRE